MVSVLSVGKEKRSGRSCAGRGAGLCAAPLGWRSAVQSLLELKAEVLAVLPRAAVLPAAVTFLCSAVRKSAGSSSRRARTGFSLRSVEGLK